MMRSPFHTLYLWQSWQLLQTSEFYSLQGQVLNFGEKLWFYVSVWHLHWYTGEYLMFFDINTSRMWFVKKQSAIQNKNPCKSFFRHTPSKQADHLCSVKKIVGAFMEREVLLEALHWSNTSLKENSLPSLFNLAWLCAVKNESVINSYNNFSFIFCSFVMQIENCPWSVSISWCEQV